jgi:hypothetical protein
MGCQNLHNFVKFVSRKTVSSITLVEGYKAENSATDNVKGIITRFTVL